MPYEFIVTLSTIPSKLQYIDRTLDSLVNQTITPKCIILQIPQKYDFRFDGDTIDSSRLEQIKNKYAKYPFHVHITKEDNGPGTKLIGLLESPFVNDFNENTKIILVDDDLDYDNQLLEITKNHLDNDDKLQAGSYHVYDLENMSIGQGADGFILDPKILKEYLPFFNKVKQSPQNKSILHHDDIVLSYYLSQNGISVTRLKYLDSRHSYRLHEGSEKDGLHNLKGEYSRSTLNHRTINDLNQLFNKSNQEGFQTQTYITTNVFDTCTEYLIIWGFMK